MKTMVPEDVIDLHNILCQKHGASYLDKKAENVYETFQKLVHIDSERLKQFLKAQEDYATTLGNLIFLPYQPGIESESWPLYYQCATIVHELNHVHQFRIDPLRYTAEYLLESESRAFYEAECYRASCEIAYFLTGELIQPEFLDCLQAYFCTESDIKLAKQILLDAYPTIKAGCFYTPVSKDARVFLLSRGYGV